MGKLICKTDRSENNEKVLAFVCMCVFIMFFYIYDNYTAKRPRTSKLTQKESCLKLAKL